MEKILNQLGISDDSNGVSTGQKSWGGNSRAMVVRSPVDGKAFGMVNLADDSDYEKVKKAAQEAFVVWRKMPAPQRGEIVRQYGDKLRKHKKALGSLVSYEMGKSLQEGLGEVQEMIDICDFAVGLSRQLYGLQMHSERPNHRMFEQWHPLGIVGIISAFNFPVAVWSWNSALAWVCGNVCVWKPSEKTPFSAIACQNIFAEVAKDNDLPEGISNVIVGDWELGDKMANDPQISLISATGSTRMGKSVSKAVANRLGKSILELGGNNAIIVTANADLKQAVPAIVFGAVGTAGQRCTSTRRLIVHDSVYDSLKKGLLKAYDSIRIGDPLDQNNHMGPLIDTDAVKSYNNALVAARAQGGKVLNGAAVLDGEEHKSGCYVKPTLVEATPDMDIVKQENLRSDLILDAV